MPDGIETAASTGQQFMDIALMTDVKNQFVLRRVENAVQGNRELHHAQVRPEMTADLRKHVDQFVPNLLCELREPFFLKAL